MEDQYSAASKYGEVADVAFPMVSPWATPEEVGELADQCCAKIMALEPSVVMAQGEFTLCFAVIERLKEKGIPCVAACSERVVTEKMNPDGTTSKESTFTFRQFREYR